jgi:hypothetical protein
MWPPLAACVNTPASIADVGSLLCKKKKKERFSRNRFSFTGLIALQYLQALTLVSSRAEKNSLFLSDEIPGSYSGPFEIAVFWDNAPCSVVEKNSVFRALTLTTLMMKVVSTSKTSVNLYKATLRNIPEDGRTQLSLLTASESENLVKMFGAKEREISNHAKTILR